MEHDSARNASLLEVLALTPLKELNIERAIRRPLQNEGIATIIEAFDYDEDRLFDLLGDAFFPFESLKKSYLENPEAVAAGLLSKRERSRSAAIEDSKSKSYYSGPRISRGASVPAPSNPAPAVSRLKPPVAECTKVLEAAERQASAALDSLSDHLGEALIAEVFEEFAFNEGEIRASLAELFKRYPNRQTRPLQYCVDYYPSIFIVCVSAMARDHYDGERLWSGVYEELGFSQTNGAFHSKFKRAYHELVQSRGLPFYSCKEVNTQYLYTTLLHAGFSQVMWEGLWKELFLPAAKGDWSCSEDGVRGAVALLESTRCGEMGKKLPATVKSLLKKVGDDLVLPFFESALSVARSYEASSNGRGSMVENSRVILSRSGLTSTATDALLSVVERDPAGSKAGGKAAGGKSQQRGVRTNFLNPAELLLLPGMTSLVVHWGKQRISKDYAGCSVEFFVLDGESVRVPVRQGPGLFFVEDVKIPVDLSCQREIQVGMRISAPEDDESFEGFEEPNNPLQVFKQTRPGMFEFRRNGCGVYRLSRGASSSRPVDVAYVMLPGYYVEEQAGLEGFDERDSLGSRNDCRLFVCTAAPGSSGRVMREGDLEPICAWQENYKVTSHKENLLGRTAEGNDLYGYSERMGCCNGDLPVFEIEANDPRLSIDDIDAYCVCDGRRVSISKGDGLREFGTRAGKNGLTRIVVSLQRSAVPRFVQNGSLVLSQSNGGRRRDILRYRFSVVPVQSLYLEGVSRERYGLEARYRFSVADDIDIEVDGTFDHLLRDVPHDRFTPLDSAEGSIRFSSGGRTVDALVGLAGIGIKIPAELEAISSVRKPNLADALSLRRKAADTLEITVVGHRRERGLYLQLSGPLLIDYFEEPRVLHPHLFGAIDFMGAGSEQAEETSLSALVTFGRRPDGENSPAQVTLLECQKGFGCGNATCVEQDGKHVVVFDNPPTADLLCCVSLSGSAPASDSVSMRLAAGERILRIDEALYRQVGRREDFTMWMALKPRFGRKPDFESEGQRVTVAMER